MIKHNQVFVVFFFRKVDYHDEYFFNRDVDADSGTSKISSTKSRAFQLSDSDSYADGKNSQDVIEKFTAPLNAIAISEAVEVEFFGNGMEFETGEGDDTIENYGYNVSINSGAGNDTIYGREYLSGGVLYLYDNGDGNDIIYNFSANDTLNITGGTYSTIESGNDLIVKFGEGTITLSNVASIMPVIVGEFEDSGSSGVGIENFSSDETLEGGVSNDTVNNFGGSVLIYGKAGDDYVYNTGDCATIDGGAGNDTISNDGGGYSSINGGTQDYYAAYVTVNGGAGDDKISGSYMYSILDGGDDSDYIYTDGGSNKIYGGDGDDRINSDNGLNVVHGGAGNDTINGGKSNDKLYGDDGDDVLIGGAGADTLTGGNGADVFVYANGDGKDIIVDYVEGEDTIKITKGTISKTTYNGNNVVFTVGSGSITVKDGKGKEIMIVDANGDTTTETYSKFVSTPQKLWFDDDDNFVTNDAQIFDVSQISESNYSVGNVENNSNNLEKFYQSILTYTSTKK